MVKKLLICLLVQFFTLSLHSYSQSSQPVQHVCGSSCSHQHAGMLGNNPHIQSGQAERCATDQLHFDKMQNDKGYPARIQDIEDFTNSFIQQHMADTNGTTRTIYTIPVVFHVVYNTPAQNISDAQILSQLDVLNEDFRRLNADTVNTPSAFSGIVADTEIEFCLAVRDPNGQPTTGITRTQTSVTSFTSNSAVKFSSQGGKDAWPRDSYMNFWICNLTGGLLGYAQYPGGNALTDGIVVNYTNVGRPPHNPFINSYNRGRTGTHEVGHWLNLRHVWGDSFCGNDLVNDTPTQEGPNYGCPSFPRRPNSCGQSNPNGDMYVNYMDYTTDACMNSFSHGQKLRMLAALNGPRSSLLNSIACIPVTSQPYSDFNLTLTNICPGDQIQFSDNSQNGPTSWSWSFPGGVPSTSNSQNPTVTYPNSGNFDVVLTTSNAHGSHTVTMNNLINVDYYGESILFQEDFESNSFNTNGWTVENPDNHIGWEIVSVGGSQSGNRAARVNHYSYSVIGERDGLITPSLDFSNYDSLQLSFQHAYRRYNNFTSDTLRIYVSTDNGQTWPHLIFEEAEDGSYNFATAVNTTANFVPSTPHNWCFSGSVGASCFELDLSDFDGYSNVRIKFETANAYGNNLYIDNVLVKGRCLSSGPPVSNLQADFESNKQEACIGDDITFNDLSGSGVSWRQWQFPGANITVSNAANPTVNYSSAGSFDVILTVSNGTDTSVLVLDDYITVNTQPGITHTQSNVSCNGGSNGQISVTAINGTAPYTYNWQHGATSSVVQNLTAGNYSVTVTDNKGCSANESFGITEPQPIQLQSNVTNADCGLSNGSVTLNINGGSGPYQYNWSNGQQTSQISGLGNGSYTVTVTDNNSCSVSETYVINQNAGIQLTYQKTDLSCHQSNDGSITISASGGNAPYQYTWQHGVSGSALQNLSAGTYTVTVTDNTGCSTQETIQLIEPSAATITADVTHATCGTNNGSINLQLNGGNAPYQYNWSNGQQTSQIGGLAGGSYNVTVSDANGCEITENYSINAGGSVNLTYQKTDASCNNSNDGSITVSASGGSGPYQYSWQHGASGSGLQNLTAGTYIVTVTDNAGCSAQETIQVNEPSATTITADITHTSCGTTNGSISLQLNGGSGPYQYNWSNGQQTSQISGLAGGNYSVTVNDANGCVTIGNYTVNGGGSISLTYQKTDVSCNNSDDGSISVTASGGNSPYQFSWQNGMTGSNLQNISAGSYTVLVTDTDGCSAQETIVISEPQPITAQATKVHAACGSVNGSITLTVSGGNGPYQYNWSNGANTNQINSLTFGTYDVTITDANQCNVVESYTLTGSTSLNLTYQTTDVSCAGGFDGSITVTASGGNAPYQYSWLHSFNGNNPQNLSAGIYTVVISDSLGCTEQRAIEVYEPQSISLNETITDVTCSGQDGNIDVSVTGGTGSYQYNWSNGFTTNEISNLSEGTYSLTVTDANGCTESASYQVDSTGSPDIQYVKSNVSCATFEDGSISLNVSGGVGSYTYNWSNGGSTNSQTNLQSGIYTVTVTDDNQCMAVESIQIAEPAPLNVSGQVTSTSCVGNDGGINQAVFGGVGPYTFNWDNGATTQNINSLNTGIYSVTITDNAGCVYDKSYFVPESNSLSVGYEVKNETCTASADGSIELNILNGTAPFSYQWSSGFSGSKNENLTAGSYQVVVTDANSCSKTLQITVEEEVIPEPVLLIENDVCGLMKGTAEVMFKGNINPDFMWSTGQTTYLITDLSEGSYSLTVDYSPDCQDIIDFDITAGLAVDLHVETTADDGSASGSIKVKPINAISPVVYSWENIPGNTQSYVNDIAHGSYRVDVIDARGCVASEQAVVDLELISTNQSTEASLETNFEVFPNPNSGFFNIVWSNSSTENTQLYLYDLKGRTIVELELGIINNFTKSLNVEHLAKGAYILNIVSNNKHHYQKVIIE